MQALDHIFVAIGHYSQFEKSEDNDRALQELRLAVEQLQAESTELQLLRSALTEAADTLEREFLPALEDKDPLIEQIEGFRAVVAGKAEPQESIEDVGAEITGLFESVEFPCSDEELQGARERLSELNISK